jgi:carboxyl-terminal processing protease
VVALVNNGCISTGEGLAMSIKNLPNGKLVGFEGTNGSFGIAGDMALMPGNFEIDWPYGQSLNENKVVQIDSHDGVGGVVPDLQVPMTLRNAIRYAAGEDVELDYGLQVLQSMRNPALRRN